MTPALPRNQILTGDAAEVLATLPEASVDTVITSPPYYAVRDYGAAGQLGQESDVLGWVEELRPVCRGLARVLRPTGALWLNLGDAISRHQRYGVAPKSLLLAPEQLVLRLVQQDGWILRNKVIWAKSNPMPSSVSDRLTMSWEVIYLLVRQPDYYFDLDAVREPHTSSPTKQRRPHGPEQTDWAGPLAASRGGLADLKASGRVGHPGGRNPGDVWREATSSYRGAHFATYPPAIVRRPILATCPPLVCTICGNARTDQASIRVRCTCLKSENPQRGLVLDPFMGAGTTALVAEELGREWLGIELNPEYVALAEERLASARAKRAPA